MERLTSYFDRPEANAVLGSLGVPDGGPSDGGPSDGGESSAGVVLPSVAATSLPVRPAVKPPVSPELVALRWMVHTFFVAFAVLRLLDACGVQISLAGELSVLLGGLLIIAHMAATVIGTTRRNAAPDELAADREAWLAERRRVASRKHVPPPAPRALRDNHPAGGRLLACIVAGAVSAAALMAVVTFPAWVRIGVFGVLILELSAATIGAYFGYMTGRLTATVRRAWVEATAEVRVAGNATHEHVGI